MSIARFSGGHKAFRDKLNRMVDMLNSLQGGSGDGLIVHTQQPHGTISHLDTDLLRPYIPVSAVGGSFKTIPFIVYSHEDDVLICNQIQWDEDDWVVDEVFTIVAKPWLLRRTAYELMSRSSALVFNGAGGTITYVYTSAGVRVATATPAVGDAVEETQAIVDEYLSEDIIWAVPAETGAIYEEADVIWQEMNVGGRAWHEVELD